MDGFERANVGGFSKQAEKQIDSDLQALKLPLEEGQS
jgi:hypothetical protein